MQRTQNSSLLSRVQHLGVHLHSVRMWRHADANIVRAIEHASISVSCKRFTVCSDKILTMQDVPFSLEDRLKERGAKYEKV